MEGSYIARSFNCGLTAGSDQLPFEAEILYQILYCGLTAGSDQLPFGS